MFADQLDLDHPLHWTVSDVLTTAECADLIVRIDSSEPELATINAPGGVVRDPSRRNNTRVMFDDVELAGMLYQRVASHIPEVLCGMRRVGANERLRCYRYDVGQRFAPHHDGSFARDDLERSLLTFMIYLNEDFEGGETNFLELDVSVKPRTGSALLFQHPILHEGAEVTAGRKYAVRSDIMYRRDAP